MGVSLDIVHCTVEVSFRFWQNKWAQSLELIAYYIGNTVTCKDSPGNLTLLREQHQFLMVLSQPSERFEFDIHGLALGFGALHVTH